MEHDQDEMPDRPFQEGIFTGWGEMPHDVCWEVTGFPLIEQKWTIFSYWHTNCIQLRRNEQKKITAARSSLSPFGIAVVDDEDPAVPKLAEGGKSSSSSTVMTIEEVATYVRLHRSTIYRLAREGIIPGFKVGDKWRFNKDRVDQWMVEQEAALRKKEKDRP